MKQWKYNAKTYNNEDWEIKCQMCWNVSSRVHDNVVEEYDVEDDIRIGISVHKDQTGINVRNDFQDKVTDDVEDGVKMILTMMSKITSTLMPKSELKAYPTAEASIRF